jgi:SAM-dependent methyltransferase
MSDSKTHWLNLRGNLKKYDLELGTATTQDYIHDPKHITFVTARYKFVAKMMAGLGQVIEIGCGDAFGAPLIAQSVERLICTDIDEEMLADNASRCAIFKNITFEYFDFREKPYPVAADGICLVDVLEHIDRSEETSLLTNLAASLTPNGVAIFGTPNITSQQYASPNSKIGHINCKSGEELRELCQEFYHNVFMFGMNDEVLHTGFLPMAHYLWALCTTPRRGVSA